MMPDAVVLAWVPKGFQISDVSITRMQPCAPELVAAASLGSTMSFNACLWLDRNNPHGLPSQCFLPLVIALKGRGGTFFMLDSTAKKIQRRRYGVMSNRRRSGICQRLLQKTPLPCGSDEGQEIIDLLIMSCSHLLTRIQNGKGG